jgi:hypothetical protein
MDGDVWCVTATSAQMTSSTFQYIYRLIATRTQANKPLQQEINIQKSTMIPHCEFSSRGRTNKMKKTREKNMHKTVFIIIKKTPTSTQAL